jgi:hypothetical protein
MKILITGKRRLHRSSPRPGYPAAQAIVEFFVRHRDYYRI